MSLTREGLKEMWMFWIPSLPDVARSSTRPKWSPTIWIKEFTSSKSLEKPTGNEPIVANDNPALFYNYEMFAIMRVDLDETIFWYFAGIEGSYTVKTDIILCKNQSGAFGFEK